MPTRKLAAYAARVNERLAALLPEAEEGAFSDGGRPWLVNSAMRYSLLAGGKRLRPAMLLAAVEMLGGDMDIALDYACAVEMIHTYSLIHDDLPGMDDDSLRRGRPTNHVVFGVGQAILAGDGLLNMAYEVMLAAAERARGNHRALIVAAREIAEGAGARGMVGGQSMDLHFERSGKAGEDALFYIHRNKTARMFAHPLRAAAHISGAQGAADALARFGTAFGVLFQATDDLLDVEGDAAEIGKTVGKDAATDKLTCVKLYGIDGTRALVDQMLAEATAALEPFGDGAAFFMALTREMVGRTK
jgi:geranylgeranyl diphosphate synthase type II